MMKKILLFPVKVLDAFKSIDFLAPLAIRVYLFPVLWFAGMNKLNHIEGLTEWFDKTMHFTDPQFYAYLVTYTELVAAVMLVIGLGVRFISIPVMILMAGAAFVNHLAHGWYYIAPETAESSVRLSKFLEWVQHYFPNRHAFITELGQPAIIQSGVEQLVGYFILALVLFFIGGGRFLSLDYWIARRFK